MYEQIAANRRSTVILFLLLFLLLGGLGVVVGELLAPGAGLIGLAVMLGVALIWILVSIFSGDRIVRALSGAHEAPEGEFPMLHNVVEEMAIAAGLPKPDVFVIDSPAPNAFATGRDPDHAAVTVTTGLMERLDRDELQGVVAHEMAHVQNRDILYQVVVAIIVGLIAMICHAVISGFRYRMMFGGGRRHSGGRGGGGAQALLVLIALIFAVLAPISATLLQLAVSRRREYLADATAARLTRYPQGLARALEKIASDPNELATAGRATQHLYIANPLRRLRQAKRSHAWSTHPPIQDRIRRLREMAFEA